MNKYEAWGRVYAVINSVLLPAGGLRPMDINNATAEPGKHFGKLYARVARDLPGWADMRLKELLEFVDPDDMSDRFNLEQQGQWQLGYYHEQSRLIERARAVTDRKNAEA